MLHLQDKKIREMGNMYQDYAKNLYTYNKLSTSPASQLSDNRKMMMLMLKLHQKVCFLWDFFLNLAFTLSLKKKKLSHEFL